MESGALYCILLQNLPREGALVAKTFGVPERWPEAGRVEFVDLRLRYGVDLPYVLDGVSLDVRANEKVGVVGRTGSGPSTAASL